MSCWFSLHLPLWKKQSVMKTGLLSMVPYNGGWLHVGLGDLYGPSEYVGWQPRSSLPSMFVPMALPFALPLSCSGT